MAKRCCQQSEGDTEIGDRLRILFVYNCTKRFVLDDLRLLRERHSVTEWYQPGRTYNPARLLRLVASHDLVFCWFASWHSLAAVLLARLLGRPALVVIGGYDTAKLPAANYGSQRGGLRKAVARAVIGNASALITNSQAARDEAVRQAGADARKITVIYHGVASQPISGARRERLVLTVGELNHENMLRKGILPFVQAAAFLPDVRFIHAGQWSDGSIDSLRSLAGPNVELCGYVSDDELQRLYACASVYVQASLHESFGLSLAEAMSAGCVPVVTRAGALPEVVGEQGIYTPSADPATLAAAIGAALESPARVRYQARQRIVDNFPLLKRDRLLERAVQRAVGHRVAHAELA